MKTFLKNLWEDESGATAIEYGLIVGIMAAVIITVLNTFSDQLDRLFQAITGELEQVTGDIEDRETNQ